MGRLRRFWEFFLTAGEYEGETRDRRGRRRIIVGILWISIPFISLGAAEGEGAWVIAVDGVKAVGHLGALLALWAWPRRIAVIIHTAFAVDLIADVTASVLLGGFYASGLFVMTSLIAVLGVLVLFTVRAAVVWTGIFIVALVFVVSSESWAEPRYVLEDPQAEGVTTIFVVMSFILLTLFYFVRQRDRLQRESDDLLHNILPDEIANRLKAGDGKLIADHFDDVSVLFLDVVDFTPMSATMAPTELVGLLDDIFSDIDGLVDELGLEKIKTVGDEYMAAAGIPVPRSDHALAMADLAIRVRDRFASHDYNGNRIVARIGINSGPVVAGIIGTRKFSYDLWGDVVNTASRMESHGVPGRIQISPSTYQHLKDDFECERRGTLEVKGKGALETWFLVGRDRQASQPFAHR